MECEKCDHHSVYRVDTAPPLTSTYEFLQAYLTVIGHDQRGPSLLQQFHCITASTQQTTCNHPLSVGSQ
jgi:hypothetical protein